METLDLTTRQFKKMPKISLPRFIYNTESELYIFNEKEGWNRKKKLLKKYFLTSGEYFSNKLYTINTLIDNKDKLNIDELVFPEKLFVLDNYVSGFTMPFIEKNVNLQIYLNSPYVNFEKKKKILKKIGILIDKLLKLNKKTDLEFFLGDIHESNFIYDINNQMFRVVDLDSCKIGNNNSSVSKYLMFNPSLFAFPDKYPLDKNGIHISNTNTTILSFIYMILNTISKTRIHRLSIEEYYCYIQYLSENGIGKDLIEMFSLIYTHNQNKLDIDFLEEIEPKQEKILTYFKFQVSVE